MNTMKLDRLDSLHLAQTGVYEPVETALVRRLLRPGQVFVDVGAHIGYYSVIAADVVGPGGQVHAFEPCPENFAILRQNVAPFGDIVRACPAAVSDVSGHSTLFLSDANTGDHRLYVTPGRALVDVPTVALDDIEALRKTRVDFIKIDVQGFEYRVLQGARRILEASPEIVGIVEFSPALLRLAGTEPSVLLKAISGMGFKIYMRSSGQIVKASVDKLPGRKHQTNLIITRKGLE